MGHPTDNTCTKTRPNIQLQTLFYGRRHVVGSIRWTRNSYFIISTSTLVDLSAKRQNITVILLRKLVDQ